jgi:hypothetical protein
LFITFCFLFIILGLLRPNPGDHLLAFFGVCLYFYFLLESIKKIVPLIQTENTLFVEYSWQFNIKIWICLFVVTPVIAMTTYQNFVTQTIDLQSYLILFFSCLFIFTSVIFQEFKIFAITNKGIRTNKQFFSWNQIVGYKFEPLYENNLTLLINSKITSKKQPTQISIKIPMKLQNEIQSILLKKV